MNTKLIAGVVVGLVIGGGVGYVVPHAGAAAPAARAQFVQGQFAGRTGGTGGAGRAAGTAGQIIGKDASSITVKLQDGSTKIVLIGTSTPIMKTAQGSPADLTEGENVFVAGGVNADGSITAQSVELRPAR